MCLNNQFEAAFAEWGSMRSTAAFTPSACWLLGYYRIRLRYVKINIQCVSPLIERKFVTHSKPAVVRKRIFVSFAVRRSRGIAAPLLWAYSRSPATYIQHIIIRSALSSGCCRTVQDPRPKNTHGVTFKTKQHGSSERPRLITKCFAFAVFIKWIFCNCVCVCVCKSVFKLFELEWNIVCWVEILTENENAVRKFFSESNYLTDK